MPAPIVEALMTSPRNSLAFPFVFEHSGPNLVFFFGFCFFSPPDIM